MCLLIPPKPKKATKAKESPKPAPMPPIPRYSRMPSRACCASPSSALQRPDAYVDYLQQQYPDDHSAMHQYTMRLGLHRIDDTLHTHADKNHQATETVGKDVKDVQQRLQKMEDSLKTTGDTADAIREFCDDEKNRRWHENEAGWKEKDNETRREIERLRKLVEEKKAEKEGKKGLGEAEVLKLLSERDMRLELERLRLKKNGTTEAQSDGFISKAQLQSILDQREQAKELLRLQAHQSPAPKPWLDTQESVGILDNKEREREFARMHRLATEKPTKNDGIESQEQTLRRILDDHERNRELERLRTFEAEALKQRNAKDPDLTNTHPTLAEVEQYIDDILEKHDRKRDRERSREALRSDRRRHASPRTTDEDLNQTAIDDILSLLLRQRSAGHAADVLDTLLHRPASTARMRNDARDSDRQWILTEVLRYLDTSTVDRRHENDRFKTYSQENGGYFTTANHHAHAYTCPPPPVYQSPRSSYPDSAGARWRSPERPHVRFDSKPAVPTPYWERPSHLDNGRY